MTSEKVKTLGHAILVLLGAIGVVVALSLASRDERERGPDPSISHDGWWTP